MPKRDIAPPGAPCWVDLFSSDTDKSRAFYEEMFGWKSEDTGPEYGGYINFLKDDLPIAGCMHNDGQAGTPDGWSIYLATDDAQAVADATVANGGHVIVPPMAVGELGTMVVLTDAGGAAIGAWQPGLHKGFGVLGEPGAPAWFELHTRDYDASVGFYRNVFGWDTHAISDTPEFRYTTLGEGEGQLAGIMDASAFLPDGVPAHWSIYFDTENTDAALAQTTALGGSIVQAAEDTPYGRLATAADPTGARFKIVQDTSA
jgi:hypothetical protein